MKGIKHSIHILLFLIVVGACEEHNREIYTNSDGRFVRFNFMVDKNELPVNPKEINPNASVVSFYEHKLKQDILIPVSITSEPLSNEVKVYYSVETIGDYSGATISPLHVLTYNGTQLNDTIKVEFTERWDANNTSLLFKIDSVSDAEIEIGIPGNKDKHAQFEIQLSQLYLNYSFQANNNIEIVGSDCEEVQFEILFPDGFFASELKNKEIFSVLESNFMFNIHTLPLDSATDRITAVLTLEENIDIDAFSFKTVLQLNTLENYNLAGNNKLTITKPERVFRNNAVNTASNFYNLKDGLYRTYGETWMDYNKDDTCEWRSYNTFTYPVVVASTHPNAILYDDKGTTDTNDDVYHHAFRIGFNSPNLGRTTNSFNLKRLLANNYTDSDLSPGFNISEALEFYPTNGTSKTDGLVRVIAQDLVISSKSPYTSYTISISGDGEYHEIADGIFEISFELRIYNETLFGGTRATKFKLYNTPDYEDPENLSDGCFMPVNL